MNEPSFQRSALILALSGTLCAAAGSAVAADAPAIEKVSVRSTAHFGFDRAAVRQDDQARLLAEVATMTDVTWQSVTATGHTDSVGPVVHNRQLSDRRALAVKAFLVGKGLDPAMIETHAQAADAPAAPNDSATGRSRNRRTEIVFQGVRAAKP
jgi:OmpA-OmpF porin, OOP family